MEFFGRTSQLRAKKQKLVETDFSQLRCIQECLKKKQRREMNIQRDRKYKQEVTLGRVFKDALQYGPAK